ncbi:hypothetical protein O9G_005500 [Rozella allomycis CSF55]|uniref:Uncharacterized protein n=1 Tax=Rozella allomycis (strain CSF55) TaxID=988480 RepID=A0A075B2H1_ROZAC|nr:hypothetical protein O9G_005500 [Rozella allomycis CSF55]|eukprot:EPZ36747.1 hypothetical protein O9G_005500 [Rozella allomycis CSF55]
MPPHVGNHPFHCQPREAYKGASAAAHAGHKLQQENPTPKVLEMYKRLRTNMVINQKHPRKHDFNIFFQNLSTKDDFDMLLDLLAVYRFSRRTFDVEQAHPIIMQCAKHHQADKALEMLLNRRIYGLNPGMPTLFYLSQYFHRTCVESIRNGDPEQADVLKNFYCLMQMFPIFPDYFFPVPRRLYTMTFDIASQTNIPEIDRIAKDFIEFRVLGGHSLLTIDDLYIAKFLSRVDPSEAGYFIETAKYKLDNETLTTDDDVVAFHIMKAYILNNEEGVESLEILKNMAPTDNLFLRGDKMFGHLLVNRFKEIVRDDSSFDYLFEKIQSISSLPHIFETRF